MKADLEMSKSGDNAAAGRWEPFLSLSPPCCLPPSFPCTPARREMPCPAPAGRQGRKKGDKERRKEAGAAQLLHLGGTELGGGLHRAAGPPGGQRGAALGGCWAVRSSPRILGRVWFFPHSAFVFLRECIQPCSPPALWLSPRGSSPAARCGTAGRWAWPPQCVGGFLGAAAVLFCLNAAICNSQLIRCCSSGQSVQKRA